MTPGGITASSVVQRGVELQYAEDATSSNITNTSSADWTGMSVTVTIGSRPVMVIAYGSYVNHTVATGSIQIELYQDTSTLLGVCLHTSATAGAAGPLLICKRLALSAGSHTFNVKRRINTAGTGTFNSTFNPAYVQVVEI